MDLLGFYQKTFGGGYQEEDDSNSSCRPSLVTKERAGAGVQQSGKESGAASDFQRHSKAASSHKIGEQKIDSDLKKTEVRGVYRRHPYKDWDDITLLLALPRNRSVLNLKYFHRLTSNIFISCLYYRPHEPTIYG